MDGKIVALILFVVLAGIFVLTYVLNKRVPRPEGCDEIDESCLNCANSLCKHRPKKENESKED